MGQAKRRKQQLGDLSGSPPHARMKHPLISKPNPLRQKLKRFLEVRWTQAQIPVTPSEVQAALGLSDATWRSDAKKVRRWISLLGWKECSRKISSSQPARKGFWPPLRPAPRIDDWSEYDT